MSSVPLSPTTSAANVQPVILCGGSGSRLWPLSRTGYPKQFLALAGSATLFQQAAERLAALQPVTGRVRPALVVTHEEHRYLASEQMRERGLAMQAALLEPLARNTAPALTLAALASQLDGQDPVLVVTPADQTVADAEAFSESLHRAIEQAREGRIMVLGVVPERAETGYGYIEATEPGQALSAVMSFQEKPDARTAEAYLASGRHYWNAGIFVLRASVWLDALARFAPAVHNAVQKAWAARQIDAHPMGLFIRPEASCFAACPAISVDYAVMERCPGSGLPIGMARLDAGWNDLGAWDAVWRQVPRDDAGNAFSGDVLARDSSGCYVNASHRLVGVIGARDLVVVETADAVLVSDRARAQEVKHLVEALSATERNEPIHHRKVYRPWGWYDNLDDGPGFKVKRILVHPGASLSLQRHRHRSEHWVVVSGLAEVVNGDEVLRLSANQSTYIARGQVHRLTNVGSEALEIIEVQAGDLLSEDDIERLSDQYGRHTI